MANPLTLRITPPPGTPEANNPLAPDWMRSTGSAIADWMQQQHLKSQAMGYEDPATGLPTQRGLLNALAQYPGALVAGSGGPGDKPVAAFDWTPGGGSKTAQIGNTQITYGIGSAGDTGEVILVKTPSAYRGQGEARAAMQQFVDHADTQGTTLFLNADPMDKGVSKGGLDRFYKSLGFVKNMGKRKDFRSTAEYVRYPPENTPDE